VVKCNQNKPAFGFVLAGLRATFAALGSGATYTIGSGVADGAGRYRIG
jgi:hypothetical protein